MPDIRSSVLLPILLKSNNPGGYCVVTILAWAMTVDEEIAEAELNFLGSISKTLNFEKITRIIDGFSNDLVDVQLACEYLSQTFVCREDHYKLIELVVLMVISDGRLRFSELQVLYLIADLFRITPQILNKIYRNITRKDLPPSPDFSSKDWWTRKSGHHNTANHSRKGPALCACVDVNRLKALAALGLDEEATQGEIRDAYLRMVQIHHPDKFHSLGDVAVKAAEKAFARINASYELLRTEHA